MGVNDLVMDTLLVYFNVEISNKVSKEKDELIIDFVDGKKAKIKFVSLS